MIHSMFITVQKTWVVKNCLRVKLIDVRVLLRQFAIDSQSLLIPGPSLFITILILVKTEYANQASKESGANRAASP